MAKKEELKAQILELTREYYKEVHAQKKEFEPGKSFVHYGGRYFNDEEMVNLVDSSLDFWLTQGPWTHKFERRLADWLGVKYCAVTNSGSSANLLAFYTLTSHKLGDRRIKKGDEVITVAAGFPTTVTPIIQYGAIPVFVDVALPGFDIDVNQLEAAYSPKTKAVMMAHSLGNPFNLKAVLAFCEKHNLWLIEDNCDALGSEYTIDGVTKKTGTWGHIGTSSFYPPHHMTMGEGGAVYTNDPELNKITLSFRDWGRDCWCASGVDNTCRMRFTGQFGELPKGYDHKPGYDNFLSFINAATDALLYTQTLCNLMDEEGLGYCYLGTTVYQPQEIIDLLELPKLTFPVATLTIGWPDEEPPLSDRLPLESFVHEDTYTDYLAMDIDKHYEDKEHRPENLEFVRINNKETLAQVFTDIRYTRKDNEAMSEGLINALKRQGFLPWTVRGY